MEHNPSLQFKAHVTNLNLNNFQTDWSYGIKNYCIEVPLNGITSVPNFLKNYQAVQKLLVGAHRQTDWWFNKPTFIFGK
jgi:hypothetical protein